MIEFLLLLFIKHYIIDFVLQTDAMIRGKGIYGDRDGILHSFQHGLGTLVVASFTLANPIMWFVVALFDFVAHYHIDWLKMNYGSRDISSPKFWNHLGLDQLAHQCCYLLMVVML